MLLLEVLVWIWIKCELTTFDDIELYSQRAGKIEFACVLLLCNRLFIGKQLYVVRFSYQRWEKGVKLQGFRREKKKRGRVKVPIFFISNIRIECFWWSMMTGCGIGISIDLLQNFVVDKICLSIVVIKNPIVQPAAVAFFSFLFFSSAGNLVVKVEEQWRRKKERERCSWGEGERCIHFFFFLGLEISMEYNK